jgi:hypothetical protein
MGITMKVRLEIEKGGTFLFQGAYDVTDADSFGKACADAWTQLRSRRLAQATSVGDLMDRLNQSVLDALDGADISVSKG